VEQGGLTARIEREIEEQAGLAVVAEDSDGAIILSGTVDSAEARQAAGDIASRLATDRRIDYSLDIETVTPATMADIYADEPTTGALPSDLEDVPLGSLEPDFQAGEDLLTDPIEAVGAGSGVEGSEDPGAEGEAYVPPTDPVVSSEGPGEVAVLGGFTPTSMSETRVEPSAMDNQLGDEAIADAIRRELHEDAATSDLAIDVEVRLGVARLRGAVSGLEDAENAEEVASRVPGVREVVEELEVVEV